MEIVRPNTLTEEEAEFCELLALGCEPYIGNVQLCYSEIFKDNSKYAYANAQLLMSREDISGYLTHLRAIASGDIADIKARMTTTLWSIIDETSKAVYSDRRGTRLSPAPLRAVSVQAIKALMDLYPVKVAQESKLELTGGEGGTGITFNVIAPTKDNSNENK